MSELILNWLNQQMQLSRRITNFEDDFSNGYLLGQLLSKYNQQLNFVEFLNKDDKKSKLKNFQLLFDTFAALKVTFGSSVANDIINKKSGVAKKLLYELKMNLQKTLSPGGNAFTKMTKMTKTLSPLKKIKLTKEQYDKVDKEHFVKQMNELHPAQKSINQQKLLKKFSDFHQHQISTNNQLSQKDFDAKLGEQRKFRERQRDNLKKTADFRNEWERTNVEKWEANMTVRLRENEKDVGFRTKLDQTKIHNKTMSELNAIKSLDKDINEFERKFIKGNKKIKQIDDSDSSDYEQPPTNELTKQQPQPKKKESKLQTKLKFPSSTNAQFQLDPSVKKFPPTEQQKHQRQKKRRKMIVEQNKRYQLIEISRREKYILSTMQQTSKQQKQLQYQIWRVWQNKEIIKEDKALQEEKQRQKNETRQINAKFKREQLLKTYKDEHETEVEDAIKRQQKLIKDHNVGERKKTYNECKKIVEQLLSVSEKLFTNQQQKNNAQIEQQLLEHLFTEFVQGVQSKEDAAELELGNYVHGRGEWNLPIKKRNQEQSTDPTLDNALPDKATNNYHLGNILRLIYEQKYLNSDHKPPQLTASTQLATSASCIVSLLGPQFSGKHLAAEQLNKALNFNIVEIEQLIIKKIQEYESLKDNNVTEVSETTKKLAEHVYAGKNVTNELIVGLIGEEVTKHQNNVIVNFPTTYYQALLLTKTLSNVQPTDFIPKTQLKTKIQSFSRLVWPTESAIIPSPVKQCGVDLSLWIDVNDRTSYDRFLGRRWVDENVVSVNDDVADLVGLLRVGEKASPQIVKNYQKLMERNKLELFFSQFGIELKSQQRNGQAETQLEEFRQQDTNIQQQPSDSYTPQTTPITIKAWTTIDGHCSIPELQQHVVQQISSILQAKSLKKQQQQQDLKTKNQQQTSRQQLQKLQEEIKQKCVFTQQSSILSKLSTATNAISLPLEFITRTTAIWQSTEASTVKALKQSFEFLSTQSASQLQYVSQTKRNFINLLTREDKKFSLVKTFQIGYNKFLDDNKEMLSQQYTKDELHQRVDDLEEELFEIIEQKKHDAMEEKKANAESGWLQSQMEQFYNVVRILLQAELNRYNASQKILADFYSKKHAVPQLPYEETSQQIAYDTTLEMVTKDGACPRLDKLITQTMRLFNREQEAVDDKGKKGGKAPPAAKKDDKKGGKKNEPQEVKQPSQQQRELKRAVNIQKSIFRYRLSTLSSFSQQKLVSFHKQNQQLYKELQSYYLYTYEVENRTVFNLSKLFRQKIEKEQKIENQFELQYVDVIENQKIRNYQKEKVVVLPAKEDKRSNSLTVQYVWEAVGFLKVEAEDEQKISTKRLIHLLKHLKNNPTQKEILPENWKQITEHHIEQFINQLDHSAQGYIELWKIIIFIVLSSYTVPAPKQLEAYYNDLTAYGTESYVKRAKFTATKAWFDEEYNTIQNVRTFGRNELIKDVLFEVLKEQDQDQQEVINAQNLVKCLGLHEWLQDIQLKESITYFDVAFGQ